MLIAAAILLGCMAGSLSGLALWGLLLDTRRSSAPTPWDYLRVASIIIVFAVPNTGLTIWNNNVQELYVYLICATASALIWLIIVLVAVILTSKRL